MKIYLDNAATTQIDKSVQKKLNSFQLYGNASSIHSFGLDARKVLEQSREIIAKKINAQSKEIIFTSSGTESNNLAIFGSDGENIITTRIEHPSILNSCINSGKKIKYVKVDKEGYVDIKHLLELIDKNTSLISIIHANNEIGTIQDIEKIGKICHENKILFHVDAVQSFCKLDINVNKNNIDLLSFSSHKIHGPKGVAGLYIRNGIKLKPLMSGGDQEQGLRPGTENVQGIFGFSLAVTLDQQKDQILKLNKYLLNELLKIPNTKLNGPLDRLYNNINISFIGCEAESLLMHLDHFGIAVSSGSACTSKKIEPSKVLTAIGKSRKEALSSIRFSLSKYNTKKELDYVISKVKYVVEKLRL